MNDRLTARVLIAALTTFVLVVVMGGHILAADDVTKTDSQALDTFRALNDGPLGHVDGDEVIIERERVVRRTLEPVPEKAAEPVALALGLGAGLDRSGLGRLFGERQDA